MRQINPRQMLEIEKVVRETVYPLIWKIAVSVSQCLSI